MVMMNAGMMQLVLLLMNASADHGTDLEGDGGSGGGGGALCYLECWSLLLLALLV